MTLEDVASRFASEEILTLEAGPHPWLGRHLIRKRGTDLWLRFNEQALLEWITIVTVDGWCLMATRASPRRNLCTGELKYQVHLDWTVHLEGAKVFVNGLEVQSFDGYVEVSSGTHELSVEKEGYEAIVRRLEFGPKDRGDHRIDLTHEKLRLAPGG